MTGLFGSESKSTSQVYQNQMTGTDGSTLTRSGGGDVLLSGGTVNKNKSKTKQTVASNNKLDNSVKLGGTIKGNVTLNISDSAPSKALTEAITDGFKATGEKISSVVGSAISVPSNSVGGGQVDYVKLGLWVALGGAIVWFLFKK